MRRARERLRRIGWVREAVRETKYRRRRVFERLGSDRYSRPSADSIDEQLAGHLPERGGVFVEAGAYDGFTQSNTYWLERFRGWSGVLVEAIPELAEQAKRNRPRSRVVQCALVSDDFTGETVTMHYAGTMSLVAGARADQSSWIADGAQMQAEPTYEVRVPARTLSDVLAEAAVTRVDLLSLDVEGYEAAVLRGLDLERHSPSVLLIEMNRGDGQKAEIEAILGDRYEHAGRLSERDHLYRLARAAP